MLTYLQKMLGAHISIRFTQKKHNFKAMNKSIINAVKAHKTLLQIFSQTIVDNTAQLTFMHLTKIAISRHCVDVLFIRI